jgi:hypothetical protein
MSRHNGFLRVLHNVASAPNVDVYVNRKKVLNNIAYKQSSAYLPLKKGKYHVRVTPTGDNNTTLIRAKVKIEKEEYYTAIAAGSVSDLDNLQLLQLRDKQFCAKKYSAKLRFVHADADAPSVNVLIDGQRLIRDISFGEASEYFKLDAPEIYDIELETTSNEQIVLKLRVQLQQRKIISLVASGIPGDSANPLTAIMLLDNENTCKYL